MDSNSPSLTCTNCSFENPGDSKFCQNCGQPLARACPKCGTPNPADVKFCKNCGSELVPEVAPSGAGDLSPRLQALHDAAPQELQRKLRAAKAELAGERKPVTILFADIVDSTTIAEALDPEEWKEIVSGAHQRMGEAIYRYEGTIAQLLGDGLLAFFGAPITHEDDPVRAVHAAIDMQEAIEGYQYELREMLEGFQIRVGINSGTVVIGEVGTEGHEEYLAIGDAVNVAARLQSAAQPGKIVLSDVSAKFVKSAFEIKGLGPLELKGKSEPITAFEIVGTKKVTESGRGIKGLRASLVGRESELARLSEALTSLREGRGQIFALMGEAGIGKSRLIEEAQEFGKDSQSAQGPGEPSIQWLEGRSLSYGAGISYWPITQQLLADLGLSEGDPEVKIKSALRRRVDELFGQDAPEILPFIFHLLGLRQSKDAAARIERLDSETLKHQIFLTLAHYVESLTREAPLVLVFEDLHWADPSSLEALEHLLPLTDKVPLMILLVMRIDHEHGSWPLKMKAETEFSHRFTEVELQRLSSSDSDLLVNQLLDVADLPTRIRGLIMARSDGNPFYLEEIIRNLIDEGVIIHEDHTWRATAEIENISIPETLQGVLLARIDRLEEDVRSTLQLASVIGRSFLYRLLEAISEAERKLETHLSTLQRADLVREKSRWPELEYIFKHSLTQQAAYDSLLIQRRKRFHTKVGQAIESLFPDRQEEFLGLLAHHFEAAGETEKALGYLLRAGDKSRLEDALSEATGFYERALDLMDQEAQPDLASRTWLKLALIHQMNFDFEKARVANEKAFSLEQAVRSTAERKPQISEKDISRRILRASDPPIFHALDPGKTYWLHEAFFIQNLFAGLVEMDSESNVVPHIAKSWEVQENGKRYLFHLRDDALWTDGSRVTAGDFEWAWKRNIDPQTSALGAPLLDDILGARKFRTGESTDPDSVGVRALDELTLDVRLERPVAYFIYLTALTVTYPLPRKTIEEFGDDWWHVEHIVSNGAFSLTEWDENGFKLRRNPSYFAVFQGNLEGLTYRYVSDAQESAADYLADRTNILWDFTGGRILEKVSADENWPLIRYLSTRNLLFNIRRPPMDDLRVRKAIAHALDREELQRALGIDSTTPAYGGLVPLGLSGHSPELGLPTDIEAARRFLSEAGYPGGEGFPTLEFASTSPEFRLVEIKHRLKETLGIDVRDKIDDSDPAQPSDAHILAIGWIADYPDPDSFLHRSLIYRRLVNDGWTNREYEDFIEKAAVLQDRGKRLDLYRRADHIIVNEDVMVYPYFYASQGGRSDIAKPYLKNIQRNALGYARLKDFVIEA